MDEPASVTGLLLFARALYLAGGMVLVNATVFHWLIPAPARAPGPGHDSLQRFRQRLHAILLVAAGLVAIAAVLWFWAVTAEMNGTSLHDALDRTAWSPVLFQTRFGLVCQVRLGLLALLAVLAWNFCRADRFSTRKAVAIRIITSLDAAVLLVSVSWTGHAGAATGAAFPWLLIADSVHLLAGSIWPAGLLFFVGILSSGLARGHRMPLPILAVIAQRFAVISLAAVVVLALTGSIEALIVVRSVHALVTTPYGRLLCLKLAVFAAMLAIALWNRLGLLPRLHQANNDNATIRATVPLVQLRRFVCVELALATGIIGIVALLGTLAPPR